MLKRIILCGFVIGLLGTCHCLVCVRPISPFSSSDDVNVVLKNLQKKGVEATICGKENQAIEIWMYPLKMPLFGGTFYYVSDFKVRNGLIGTVSFYQPKTVANLWVLAIHPNGGVWSTRRETGYSLKSQSGKIGKWIGKQ